MIQGDVEKKILAIFMGLVLALLMTNEEYHPCFVFLFDYDINKEVAIMFKEYDHILKLIKQFNFFVEKRHLMPKGTSERRGFQEYVNGLFGEVVDLSDRTLSSNVVFFRMRRKNRRKDVVIW